MAKKEEGRKFITSLARDIDILNQSMQSPIERFGELGSSGNKAWTLFARAASGSFWWRLQARLRVFSNAAELFTDRQKAQNKALLESTDRLVQVKKGYDRTKDVVSQLSALGEEISGLTKGTDEYNEVIAKLTDTDSAWGDMFQGLQHRFGSDAKAFNKLIGIYRNLNKDYEDEQEKTQKGYGKFLTHKLIKKMTGMEGEDFDKLGEGKARRPTKWIRQPERDTVDEEGNITRESWRIEFGKKTNALDQAMVLASSGFTAMGDSILDIGSSLTDSITFVPHLFRKAFGGEDYAEDEDSVTKPRSRIFKALDKTFSGGLLKNLGKFMKVGAAVLMSAVMWGTAIAIGLMFIVVVLRKAWPRIKKLEEKWEIFGKLFAVFSASALLIWEGLSDLFHAIWEGDIIGILLAIWTKILPGILGVAASIIGAILTGLVVLAGSIMIAVYEAAATIVIGIGNRLASIGKASGGPASGLTLVGEKGPELVTLPSGSMVHSNSASKGMIGGNTINVHVNGRVGASDMEIRDIANKVAKEINSRVNRTSTSSMGF